MATMKAGTAPPRTVAAIGASMPNLSLAWPINRAGMKLLCESEGCRLKAYRCPAGKWTIGWGETHNIRPGMVCTQEQADAMLLRTLQAFSVDVRDLLTEPASPNEFAALLVFAYNVGIGGLKKSSVLRAHNRGDRQAAARAFGLWNNITVNGKLQESPGLTKRRAAEKVLYLTPEDEGETLAPVLPIPQEVAPESNPSDSQIHKGAAVAGGYGVLEVVNATGNHVDSVGSVIGKFKALIADTIGMPPDWVLPLVLIGAAVVIMYWRDKQRDKGWA